MTDQEAVEALVQILVEENGDWGDAHMRADDLLCELLKDKYPELVKKYDSFTKWYS